MWGELHGHGVLHDPEPQPAAGHRCAVPHAGHLHGPGEPAGALRHPPLAKPALPAVLPLHRQPGGGRPPGQRHLRLQLCGLPRVPPQRQPQCVSVQAGGGHGLVHGLGGQPVPHGHRQVHIDPQAPGLQEDRHTAQGGGGVLPDVDHRDCDRGAAPARLELQEAAVGVLRHFPAHRRDVPDVLDRGHQRAAAVHRVRLHVHPLEGAQPRRPHDPARHPEKHHHPRVRGRQGAGDAARPGPHGHPAGQDPGPHPGGSDHLLGPSASDHGVRCLWEDEQAH